MRHEGNMVAHMLACHAKYIVNETIWMEEVPEFLIPWVQLDSPGSCGFLVNKSCYNFRLKNKSEPINDLHEGKIISFM